ncbi:DeoR/GlpR family DNA-binding transcription regulator [Eubacteriales bacterium OttesenSCG-928-A19]|nr:DeoR/GlpR family DNA-binding transcription regulator [Eubacteriales bacterium OttesenSCG-928-A19]
MIKQKRYERILEIINEQHAVSIDDFCDQLGVSKATVRRDLIYLDEQKQLKRTHGGAVSLVKPVIEDVPISMRHAMFHNEKERIAQAAYDMIRDGITVYIGTGSTTRELASRLGDFSKLTILTNDIGVAYEISQNTSNSLIVAGGKLRPSSASLIGPFTENVLRDLQVELAFMSADSVTVDGFMDLNIEEVSVKRLMIKNARKSVMLCDQSKFNHNAFMTICPLSGVDLTITNDELDPEIEKGLRDNGIELHTV